MLEIDNKNNLISALVAGLLGGLLSIGLVFGGLWWQKDNLTDWLAGRLIGPAPDQSVMDSALTSIDDNQSAAELLPFDQVVIQAVSQANPAVVAIVATRELAGSAAFGSVWPTSASGSGFIVSADGLIMTNRHVVDDTRLDYTVLTNDGRQYPAEIVDKDPFLDVAILRIEADNLSYLEFADSDNLQIGQSVIAIGNALGEFRNTVSTGVISGLSRSIIAGDRRGRSELLDEVIQTDAAINLGNSGGPLLDLAGRVVGINVATAISGQNISFALPANPVKQVLASVKATGRIVRPFLGIRYVSITPELARLNNLPVEAGILVVGGLTPAEPAVTPDSPADRAGLAAGDIITHWNGRPITAEAPLTGFIRSQSVGDRVTLTIRREQDTLSVTTVLAEMPR